MAYDKHFIHIRYSDGSGDGGGSSDDADDVDDDGLP